MKHRKKDTQLVRNVACVVFVGGPGFRPHMQGTRAQGKMEWIVAGGDHHVGRFGKKIRPAAELRRGGIETRYHPDRAGQLNVLVVLAQKSGPAEGRCQTPRTVDDATDHGRVVMIRGRYSIHAEDGDAKCAVLNRDRENVDRVVILNRSGFVFQPRGQLFSVEFADEDLGESRFGGGAAGGSRAPVRRIVNGEGYGIEVALELNAGFLDEALVLGIVRHLWKRVRTYFADPAEVGVQKRVRAGEKPRRFRRSMLPQLDDENNGGNNNDDRKRNGEGASDSHEMRLGMMIALAHRLSFIRGEGWSRDRFPERYQANL